MNVPEEIEILIERKKCHLFGTWETLGGRVHVDGLPQLEQNEGMRPFAD